MHNLPPKPPNNIFGQEKPEVFIFGRWATLREAKKILSEVQLPEVPKFSHFHQHGETDAHTCGWSSCSEYTCASTCNSTCSWGGTCGHTCTYGSSC